MAHFLLAKRAIGRRDFRRAIRYLEDSESWGAPAGDVASFKALIYKEQQEWELAERWAETALAYGSRANPAEMHHVIGLARYFREEIDKAVEAFETALAIRDDPEIRASLARALREARASDGFDQKRLSHFIVSYEGETMEDTGRMVLDQMERSYSSLVSDLGIEPSEPVVVILYSRRSYRDMGGPHWSAGFFDGKIRVPVRGLERLDASLRSTLHHELAHAFIHAKAGDAAPRWLHEGIAQHVEGVRTTPEYGKQFAEFLNDGQSFEHCLSAARCDVRVFYPAAASLVDYMVQNRGMGGLRDVLVGMGEGLSIDESLRKVWGRDQIAVIREWQHFIRRRYS
jgi:tetratricopeptide (TPR) repeat protein